MMVAGGRAGGSMGKTYNHGQPAFVFDVINQSGQLVKCRGIELIAAGKPRRRPSNS